MFASTALGYIVLATVVQSGPDAEQFEKLVAAAHAQIHDVSFLFEGGSRFVGSEFQHGKPYQSVTSFQSAFLYRSDGAMRLDRYDLDGDPEKLSRRTTIAVLGKEMSSIVRHPKGDSSRVLKEPYQKDSLNTSGSPFRFFWLDYFRSHDHLREQNYEFLGWDNVADRKCMHVRWDLIRRRTAAGSALPPLEKRSVIEFWIDMERGAHPLKVEIRMGGKLHGRMDGIKLAPFSTMDNQTVWLPVAGQDDSFIWEGEFRSSPTYHETYSVLDGMVRVNQGLKDEAFTLKGDSSSPENDAFKTLEAKSLQPPLPRDPESRQQQLDADLVEADKQAERLEASSPARQGWGTTQTLQVIFGAFAVVLVVGAVVLKRRGA